MNLESGANIPFAGWQSFAKKNPQKQYLLLKVFKGPNSMFVREETLVGLQPLNCALVVLFEFVIGATGSLSIVDLSRLRSSTRSLAHTLSML
jgi:hypothetical protein